jgi:hypothetical protein
MHQAGTSTRIERRDMAAKKKAKRKATVKRTTHRSTGGTKLYAKRKSGEFEDIQTYKRAHGSDVKRVSKAEVAARKKAGKPARKKARKSATKK